MYVCDTLRHSMASRSDEEETWRLLATSFDVMQAIHIFHCSWKKCSQPITGLH
jgi:hypothetical protein